MKFEYTDVLGGKNSIETNSVEELEKFVRLVEEEKQKAFAEKCKAFTEYRRDNNSAKLKAISDLANKFGGAMSGLKDTVDTSDISPNSASTETIKSEEQEVQEE